METILNFCEEHRNQEQGNTFALDFRGDIDFRNAEIELSSFNIFSTYNKGDKIHISCSMRKNNVFTDYVLLGSIDITEDLDRYWGARLFSFDKKKKNSVPIPDGIYDGLKITLHDGHFKDLHIVKNNTETFGLVRIIIPT